MKKHFRYGLFFALGAMLALGFVACGDESSSGPSKNEETGIETEESSSSVDEVLSSSVNVEESSSSFESEGLSSSVENEASSSSEKSAKSSSSKDPEPAEKSSSSVKTAESSSSVKVGQSSSSEKVDVSSSSSKVQESSSSVKVEESSSSDKPVEPSSSEKIVESSSSEEQSSSSVVENSSSSLESTGICKTKTEDNCVYGSLYDERDGKTYKTVKIGEQEWMAENLSYAYNEGHDYSGSFYSRCYNGDTSNCEKYGRLYQWGMAIDSIKLLDSLGMRCGYKRIGCNLPEKWRGLCPKGFHLPSKKEWENLIAFVGEQSGLSLKSMDGWVSSSSVAGTVGNGNGMDYYGFSVLPSGTMQAFQYYNMNERALFWTASDDSEKNAHGIKFSYASDLAITSYITSKQDANSVRCIKD